MDRSDVEEYIEETQSTIDASPQMGEATTKAAVLRDFLEILDWDIPDNTQLEYSVNAFGKTYKVDYALILEGTPVAFIEAKGVDTPLNGKHREQLSAYLKNEDVNWGILTNAEEYEFYRRRIVDSKIEIDNLANLRLRNLSDRITVLRAFTKEAIQTGNSEKIATRINKLQEARTTLETEKDELANEIKKTLTESVSDVISSQSESQAKEMIDRLVADIETEIDSDGGSSAPDEIETPDTSPSKSSEYVIRIKDGDETIATFSGDVQGDVMGKAVDYLVENHGLISKVEPLPYRPGRDRITIHNQTTYPDENKEMRSPRELTGGYYVETHDNSKAKYERLENLAEKSGLGIEFDGAW
jgi:hypothetical protein